MVDLKEFNWDIKTDRDLKRHKFLQYVCEIVFEMNNLQLRDKALDQEASYEAYKTWLANGQWFNWQLQNSLKIDITIPASLLLAVTWTFQKS